MQEKIRKIIKSVTAKQLIIFIIVTFIFNKIWYYWLSDWLFDILHLTTVYGVLQWCKFSYDLGVILEIAYLIAFIWLIIKGLASFWKKDYAKRNLKNN